MTDAVLEAEPAVAAHAHLEPRRYPNLTVGDLYRRVVRELVFETDMDPGRIDGVYAIGTGTVRGNEMTHGGILDELGVEPTLGLTMYAGGATYAIMLDQAARAIATGQAEAVLCLGVSKFGSVDEEGETMARRVSHPEFEFPYGTFIPALYSLAAKRYMYEYGATREDLARVSVSSREWALRTPTAYMHDDGSLTVEDVLDSRRITDPFHLLHCSVPVEGGGGFLVAGGPLARDVADVPAYVRGLGQVHTHGYVSQAPSYTTMGGAESATAAYEMADLEPDDVDVAEIYDAFASNPLAYVEDLGFCEPGGGPEFFAAGRGAPGGDLPVNTNGGLLSYGHAGPASGMSVLTEAVAQVRGVAGERQVDGAEVALAHTYGGMMADHATVLLGRAPP